MNCQHCGAPIKLNPSGLTDCPYCGRQPKPGTIRCTGCNRELAADRANLTANGLQCETCWRQQVDATEAAVQQSMNSSSIAAGALVGVAAVLLGAVAGSQQR